MKAHTYRNRDETVFSVLVNDMEIQEHEQSRSLLHRFREHVLSKMGSMIAAYYFKNHKDELLQFIHSNDFKQAITDEISRRIIVKVEIDGNYTR